MYQLHASESYRERSDHVEPEHRMSDLVAKTLTAFAEFEGVTQIAGTDFEFASRDGRVVHLHIDRNVLEMQMPEMIEAVHQVWDDSRPDFQWVAALLSIYADESVNSIGGERYEWFEFAGTKFTPIPHQRPS